MRAVLLSLLLLLSIASIPPLTSSFASYRKSQIQRSRRSAKWWRRHRAQQRRQRALAAARRRQRLTATLEKSKSATTPGEGTASAPPTPPSSSETLSTAGLPVPTSWRMMRGQGPGEVRFDVRNDDGRQTATAVLTKVSVLGSAPAPRSRSIGGVPIADLRRTVVDRMYSAGGWVVNDTVREVDGQRLFIVQAASGNAPTNFGASVSAEAPQARVSWNYYFTEVDGQIYSLATATTPDNAAPLASESVQVMASLPRFTGGIVAALQ